ncbi:metalloregulator ArsR/SmtB family transcription factor [Candidatus Woesearchaeota archaeon]|nr:metalloregulator ArsR/SmtB family transcription factor [Candidatus Woesearchaeota archaeon]
MFKELSKYYKALSEPTRLQILYYLLNNDKCTCICELQEFIKKDQSVLSRHMKILEQAKLIKTKKQGKYLICCLTNKNKTKKILEENKNQ